MKKLSIKKNITFETSALPCSCYGSCSWDSPTAKKITSSVKQVYKKMLQKEKQMV